MVRENIWEVTWTYLLKWVLIAAGVVYFIIGFWHIQPWSDAAWRGAAWVLSRVPKISFISWHVVQSLQPRRLALGWVARHPIPPVASFHDYGYLSLGLAWLSILGSIVILWYVLNLLLLIFVELTGRRSSTPGTTTTPAAPAGGAHGHARTTTVTYSPTGSLQIFLYSQRRWIGAFVALALVLAVLQMSPWSVGQAFNTVDVFKSRSAFSARAREANCDTMSGVIAQADIGGCIALLDDPNTPSSAKSAIKGALDATCLAYYFYLPGTPQPSWVPKGDTTTADQYNKLAERMSQRGNCTIKKSSASSLSSWLPRPSVWLVFEILIWLGFTIAVNLNPRTRSRSPLWSPGWFGGVIVRAIVAALIVNLTFRTVLWVWLHIRP